MVTPGAKRQAVVHLVASHEMSARRACRMIGCFRMTMRCENVRQDDPVPREWLRELAKVRRRSGCQRLQVFLRREGHEVNRKPLFRICRGLHVRRRGGRKRAMGTRAPTVLPLAANQHWSPDLVPDQLTDGRRFQILTGVQDCTRECLGLDHRHLAVGSAGGAGAGSAVQRLRQASDKCQRQRPGWGAKRGLGRQITGYPSDRTPLE